MKRADVPPSRVFREPKRRPQAAAGSELMILAATRDAAPWRPLLTPQRAGRELRIRSGTCGAGRLRYLPGDPADAPDDYVLGWTEIDAVPEGVPDADDDAIRDWVSDWLQARRSLLAAVRSHVLPEADVVLMNPLHSDAAR